MAAIRCKSIGTGGFSVCGGVSSGWFGVLGGMCFAGTRDGRYGVVVSRVVLEECAEECSFVFPVVLVEVVVETLDTGDVVVG